MSIEIEPPESTVTVLFESRVTAVPLVRVMLPPLAIRILSAAVPVALDVRIGVVRSDEMTISAWAPAAANRGAIATAVASRIRIRKKTPGGHTITRWATL
ncbi:hypothetical protein [Brevundimonas nasdae]|uniref:hypothetical protein n=1 Tax=Brevundimonas nasdae TaxID=172043 RepID=UPI00289FB8FA|nr:hypothetical protein [Brevundimonas nasdae]